MRTIPERAGSSTWLLELPDELLIHCTLLLLSPTDFSSAQTLTWVSRDLHERLQPVRAILKARRHSLRWSVKSQAEDVVLSGSGRGLRAASDGNWRRAYGRPLPPRGCSIWAVRIDSTRASQGLLLIGVSLTQKWGVCEWSVSPFYGRLLRRSWDRDGNLLLATSAPPGYPDGHLVPMLVDEEGATISLEGRANGAIIEVVLDHDEGTLAFRLNGADGPRLEGFPAAVSGTLLRPVIGFRWAEDRVTIRSGPRLREGWPQQVDHATRERDAVGLQAARALRARVAAARASASSNHQ